MGAFTSAFGNKLGTQGEILKIAAPTNLILEVISDTQINLTWGYGDSVTGFKIERSTDNIIFEQIATAETNSYNNIELTRGTIYYYRVRAFKGSSNSDYSNTADDCTTITTLIADGNTYLAHDINNLAKITKDVDNNVSLVAPIVGTRNLTQIYKPGYMPVWVDGEGLHFIAANGDFLRSATEATYTQPATMYIVLKLNTWTSGKVLIYGGNSTSFSITTVGNSPIIKIYGGSSYSIPINLEIGRWVIIRLTLNGAGSKFQINNRYAIQNNWGTAAPAGLSIAGNNSGANNADINYYESYLRKVADSELDNQAFANFLSYKYKSKVTVIPDAFPLTSICHVGDSLTYLMGQANKFNEFSDDYTLALPGVGITQMVDKWNTLTYSLQMSYEYIFIMAGSNHYLDSMPNFATVYQAFVNQLKLDAPQAKVIVCTIPPCRGNVNWTEPRYANWLLFNEAIMGNGANPITGADGVCYLHTDDLGDANDYLLSAYDIGDKLHLNDAGYTILANRMKEFIT